VEHHFEDPANYPSGREMDSYDAHSKHVALIYKPSGEVVGASRLILSSPTPGFQFPMLALLGKDAVRAIRQYPLDQMAEISRYSVSKNFRRRKDEEEYPDIGISDTDAPGGNRLTGRLSIEVIRGLMRLAVSQQIRYCCACMRPALFRLLTHLGLTFHPIGPPVQHHGFRQPCVAAVSDLIRDIGLRLSLQSEQRMR